LRRGCKLGKFFLKFSLDLISDKFPFQLYAHWWLFEKGFGHFRRDSLRWILRL
jgi:hypothetical protein